MVAAMPVDKALEQPARAALHAAVRDAPGITFNALWRAVDRPAGTVRYHLSVLIRCGLLKEQRVGSCIAFVLATETRDPAKLRALRDASLAALRDLIANWGRVCQRDLLDYLDGALPRSTVQHRLNRLARAGLVRVTMQGRYLFYEAMP